MLNNNTSCFIYNLLNGLNLPNFQAHFSSSILIPAVAVGLGTAYYGWNNESAALGFIAGFVGGMLPDLDSDTSRPLRATASIVGLACAAFVFSFFSVKSGFLNRPWPKTQIYLACVLAYVLFNIFFVEIMRRTTRHRGLFHSMPMAFFYASLWAFFVSPFGSKVTIAIWLMAVLGVMVHLIFDAVVSLSLDPLKFFTSDFKASARLWLLVAFFTFLAFYRLG